ncbi:NAD-dependent epimerase/dehydratase family protein [Streptomyces sp. NPDC088733]|uniref:NAD-dependent epimerase/dehydratase family protein n=1 Tax=Streptomyces sp. NPDC088733 TaxID=3365880 RepID=UPI00381BB51F
MTSTPAHGPRDGLHVVVVGATGNVGTSLVRALGEDPAVARITGIARRVPADWRPPRTTWVSADITDDSTRLSGLFDGADAVVHLAWLLQPSHDPAITWRTNVLGGIRVFDAVAAAGVPALVHASSVAAYSPGPKDHPVDESWPTHGWPGAAYCREKAYIERYLDGYEADHPRVRVVRMRPGFLFKKEAAAQQRRLFAGPFLPGRLVRPRLVPVVPDMRGLRFQALHTDDAADAYRRAVLRPVRGPFNLAAEPPLDAAELASIFGAQVVRMPRAAVRAALAGAWRLHLVPSSPGLFDAVLRLPLLDTGRARRELGWRPQHSATHAVEKFLEGLREGSGANTAVLAPSGAVGRLHEVATGVGSRP